MWQFVMAIWMCESANAWMLPWTGYECVEDIKFEIRLLINYKHMFSHDL